MKTVIRFNRACHHLFTTVLQETREVIFVYLNPPPPPKKKGLKVNQLNRPAKILLFKQLTFNSCCNVVVFY